MKTSWLGKLVIAILGTLNGALYSAAMLFLIWRLRLAAEERNAIEGAVFGDYVHLVSHERWVPIVIVWLVVFTVSALMVDYFWHGWKRVLFWEAVGVIAIAGWNVLALVGTWIDKQGGDTISHSLVTSSNNPLFGPTSLLVVLVANLLFGFLVRSMRGKLQHELDVDQADLRPTTH